MRWLVVSPNHAKGKHGQPNVGRPRGPFPTLKIDAIKGAPSPPSQHTHHGQSRTAEDPSLKLSFAVEGHFEPREGKHDERELNRQLVNAPFHMVCPSQRPLANPSTGSTTTTVRCRLRVERWIANRSCHQAMTAQTPTQAVPMLMAACDQGIPKMTRPHPHWASALGWSARIILSFPDLAGSRRTPRIQASRLRDWPRGHV